MKTYPRLNVGCGGSNREPGKINADLYPGPNVDVVFDATKPWPFADGSIGAIQANHVFEHLPEPWNFMREAWRVLVPSPMANLYLRLPYGPSEGGVGDVTHLRYYTATSFACFQQGYIQHSRNPQYGDWATPFEVTGVYRRIDRNLRWLCKPVVRRWGVPALHYLWNGYCELIVGMRPMKRGESLPNPGVIPYVDVIYEHDYQGRDLKPGEEPSFRYFG